MKIVRTIRIDKDVDEALNEAKWELRKSKTQILEEAVIFYLKEHCPEVYQKLLEKKQDKD
jgi:predicted transcriptional regulator